MVKILLVEDDPIMAKMYFTTLVASGYEVQLANDGEEGLLKAKSFAPALILLDVMMPKMNGMEVLAHLKADPETKAIHVVMLTNLSGDVDAETALAKGADKYLIKSDYEPPQVADIIKGIVGS